MRKLASIQKIKEIIEHPNADKLEVAVVNGWKTVVKKGEFQVGDSVVYFEIDSWISNEVAPFLTKPGHSPKVYLGVEGQRLKTMKIRGVLSQGLVLPFEGVAEGDDVTERLGVLKWEAPDPAMLGGQSKGSFPSFIFKTDQERVQNIWESLKNNTDEWEVTTKLDGSSMTVYYNNGEFGVCSRNQELNDEGFNTFWKVAKENNFERQLRTLGLNIALQGELMGPGIQKNRENLSTNEFYLYDIFLIDEGRHATPDERLDIVDQLEVGQLEVETVPHLSYVKNISSFQTLDEFMGFCEKLENGKSLNADTREGVVFKNVNVNKFGQVESFKVISNNYLLNE